MNISSKREKGETKRAYGKRMAAIQMMRDELQSLLDIPRSIGWTNAQSDKVEELASELEFTEEDKYWHSI
jgi:hypothetical protein